MLDAAAALAPYALLSRNRYSGETVRVMVTAGAQEAARWLEGWMGEYGAGLLRIVFEGDKHVEHKLDEVMAAYLLASDEDQAVNNRALADGFFFVIDRAYFVAYSFAYDYARFDCVAELAGYLAIPAEHTWCSSKRAIVRAGARAAAELCKRFLFYRAQHEVELSVGDDKNELFACVFRLFCDFQESCRLLVDVDEMDGGRWECFDFFYTGFVYVLREVERSEK
ncbi:hypothetical protein CJO09_03870 [Neopusillimonas maritima]|uniref:Uncharacterized protein n=2 Tax=Neopusillimonas maritima TaxID=2026239 RepID=A0ABX9MZE5_9BURK|nr:hypothetical protein CJO09_03870 [Neopusillimonas maritima]